MHPCAIATMGAGGACNGAHKVHWSHLFPGPALGLTDQVRGPSHSCCQPSLHLLQPHVLSQVSAGPQPSAPTLWTIQGTGTEGASPLSHPTTSLPGAEWRDPLESNSNIFQLSLSTAPSLWGLQLGRGVSCPSVSILFPTALRKGRTGDDIFSLARIPQPFPPSFKSQPLMAQLRRGAECSPLSVEGFLLPQPIRWYCWEEATSKGANRKIPCFIISEPHA